MPAPAAGRPLTRRTLLAGTVAGAGGVLAAGTAASAPRPADHSGPHQPGIVSPPLPYLSIAGFDLRTHSRQDLIGLLRAWTTIVQGYAEPAPGGRGAVATTVTFGFGPSLFTPGRFGLADRRPEPFAPLPPFPGESLDPGAGGGDLCVQACAADPTTAHRAVRDLLNVARPLAALRWRQTGFRAQDGTPDPPGLFGFRDGTANLDVTDPGETARHLWVGDGPSWLHGGTYLVVRRIRLLLDTWDRTPLATQESIIGRQRDSNVELAGVVRSHARLASPAGHGGVKLLRRSYSYDAGVDPNRLLDSGLIFICFQRDPQRQFVPIQRRLAADDMLNAYSQHLASGVFACPPGYAEDSWVGAELFA